MGHDKLRKFAENETFACLLQPPASEILGENGFFDIRNHSVKGNWNGFFEGLGCKGESSGLVLELGCGKGEYTLELARRNPSARFVGMDIKGARLWRGARTATTEPVVNAAFLRTRIEFITAFFAPEEVSEIWLTFSDPQIKSENSRLTSPLFLERYRRILKKGGTVHLKTDSRFLHEYTKAVIEANGLRMHHCSRDLYGSGSASDGIPPIVREVHTFYENMFLEMGLPITYLSFSIDRDGAFVYPENFDKDLWIAGEKR